MKQHRNSLEIQHCQDDANSWVNVPLVELEQIAVIQFKWIDSAAKFNRFKCWCFTPPFLHLHCVKGCVSFIRTVSTFAGYSCRFKVQTIINYTQADAICRLFLIFHRQSKLVLSDLILHFCTVGSGLCETKSKQQKRRYNPTFSP